MSQSLGELAVILTANAAKFDGDVNTASKSLKKFNDIAMKATAAASAVFAAGAGLSTVLVNAASDAAEQLNVLNIAFGNNTNEVIEWATVTSKAVGRSATDLKNYAGDLGALVSPTLGVNDATKQMSQDLALLAVDLGSVRNATEVETLTALKAALIGSSEPMQKFGVNMNVAALEAFALSKGLSKAVKEMNEGEKVQLRYAFLMEKTAGFQGDAVTTAHEQPRGW